MPRTVTRDRRPNRAGGFFVVTGFSELLIIMKRAISRRGDDTHAIPFKQHE